MSGEKAVQNGQAFESKIFAVLNNIPGVKVIKDIPYPSIYSAYSTKHKTKMEFRAENISLIYETLNAQGDKVSKTRFFKTLNIECKYQEGSGTTDEKYPLVYENALISDAEATLFVYQDPRKNIKKGALEFMYDKALNSHERLIVMDFDTFLATVNQEYSLQISPEDVKQGTKLFMNYHTGLKTLESLSRKRFKAEINKSNRCVEYFEEYLHCQRIFHNFIAKHGIQGDEYIPFLNNLRTLREGIKTCLT